MDSSGPAGTPAPAMAIRRILVVLPAVAFLAVLGTGLFRARPVLVAGSNVPPFTLPTVSGDREVSLGALRGKPAVLNFWASWCEPCRDEAPALAAAAARSAGAVQFVGINILDGRDEALAFMRQYGITYLNLRDSSGGVARRYQVTGVPETVFVDSEGRFAGKFVGDASGGVLDGLVSDLQRLPEGGSLHITGRGRTKPVP